MRTAAAAIVISLIMVVLVSGCANEKLTGHAVVNIGRDLQQSGNNDSIKTGDSGTAVNSCNPDGGVLAADNPIL